MSGGRSSSSTTQQDNKITVANGGVFLRDLRAGRDISVQLRDPEALQLARSLGEAGIKTAALGLDVADRVAKDARINEKTLQRVLLAGTAVAALAVIGPVLARAVR